MTGNIAKKNWQNYIGQLQRNPLRTKAITAAVLQAISDIVSQKLSGIKQLQIRRILLKVILGFVYVGPFGHYFHTLLDKIFKGKKDTKTVAKKVVLEQVTVSPLNNLLFLIYYGSVIEGRPWSQVKSKVRKDFPKLQLASWMVRPAFGWINHQYVPFHLRVVFQSMVAFCWGIFMNLLARSPALTKP